MIAIDQLAQLRRLLDKILATVPAEALFEVPRGFSNHIAWNAAHIVVTQQLLSYALSGLDTPQPMALIDRYRKGTSAADGDETSYREVITFLHEAPVRVATDHAAGRFVSFSPYKTSAGVPLDTLDQALAFNNIHEGIHLGYILAQRKALGI